jgi:hypothetical protein
MTPRELRIVSALAVFLCAALPAAAGAIAFRAQPILAATITGEVGALPGLTGFYFNQFTGALVTLLVAGLGVTAYAARAHWGREADETVRLAKLLVATCFAALVSVVFLGLLVLATVLPVYAKLMQR